jgi:hypothetical protein
MWKANENGVRQLRSPAKMAATVQLRCYWKQLWSRWAITSSWEPLVSFLTFMLSYFPMFFEVTDRSGSYVKLSSAVGVILVEGLNRLTYFRKRTIQWLFHQHLVLAKNRKKGGMKLKKNLLLCNYWANLNQTLLKWSLGGPLPKYVWHVSPPTKMGHPKTIPPKFGCNWPSGFWGKDFYVNFP